MLTCEKFEISKNSNSINVHDSEKSLLDSFLQSMLYNVQCFVAGVHGAEGAGAGLRHLPLRPCQAHTLTTVLNKNI